MNGKMICFFLMALLLFGCVSNPGYIFLSEDSNASGGSSSLDGGFANSVYLAVQHVDGGAAT